MAIKSGSQLTILDLSDAYSVNLSSEAHVFAGTTNSVNGTQSITTKITGLCGPDTKVVSVDVSTITKPTGISVTSDNKTPSPTLTITATSAVTTAGILQIPITFPDDGITLYKDFSYSIAFKGTDGNGITSSLVEYAKSTSGTTPPNTGWSTSIPQTNPGDFLWQKRTDSFKTGSPTVSYTCTYSGLNGSNGTSVTVTSTKTEYVVSTSNTPPATGWSTTYPANIPQGSNLFSKVQTFYSDGKSTSAISCARQGVDGQNGQNGAKGDNAISITITSSNGLIFKNSKIATTLTASVFSGGKKLSKSEIDALGTLKWYKDSGTTSVGTGETFTVTAGDVSNSATYTCNLEG